MTYAIIEDSGRQMRVEQGQELLVDYRDVSPGEELRFEQVLLVSNDSGIEIGSPLVAGAAVTAEVVGVTQGPKLDVHYFRRRKNSRRKTGHRQLHTTVRITKIEGP